MARNGTGTYVLPVNSWNPATNGNSATAADWQSLIDDVESALTRSVSADGQTPITGNLNMNGNKLTGLGAGTATGDSLRFQQLFSQGVEADIASAATVDIGAQNTNFLQITGTTTITSFGANYNGPRFLRFAGILTLTHNASTLILPTGANITTAAGDALIAVPSGSTPNGWKVLVYQKADGKALVIPTASTTEAGIVELATDAEAQAGTDTARAITPANVKAAQIQLGTAVASTSGTAIDFTGIPSWAKRITVMFNGVSTNGTSDVIVQIGDAGGVETTGYLSYAARLANATAVSAAGSVVGFNIFVQLAAAVRHGVMTISKLDGNTWVSQHNIGDTGDNSVQMGAGSKTLSATLDRVRITTAGGVNTFDAGTVNISWE
jgi:hypothetical protein